MWSENDVVRFLRKHSTSLARSVAAAEFWAESCERELEEMSRQDLAKVRADREQALANGKELHSRPVEAVVEELKRVEAGAGLWAAPWEDPRWRSYEAPVVAPSVVRIGTLRLAGSLAVLRTPALMPFTSGRSLVIKAAGAAKQSATRGIQALTLRLLGLVPPGRLQLLLIDPVGLGDDLAVFMNLTKHVRDLVRGQVWVERPHIEKALADLSADMETVIQTYLRGRYKTIEEYNAKNVPEPYRLLVTLDFPVNFSEDAARRLVSILTNGPTCGVYAVVLVDTQQALPAGFRLAELEQAAEVVSQDGSGFVWQDPDFRSAALEWDELPPQDRVEGLLKSVGSAAKERSAVELQFDTIAPTLETSATWWDGEQGDASTHLKVPIGRAGPDVLHFELGEGMAQHALVAGRTGSGKSSLLHVLITGLATIYPPDELELYLIDFKTVEFKDYAAAQLPHARVIAIESEREFALSVLRDLDREYKSRKDTFSKAGCHSLVEYRRKVAGSGKEQHRTPRILLLVDEFQEFFVEDDGISREANLLLDRLARQGRGFGMHVLLGSQTLAGAYSLARSTMDQMNVRIALQCSEADSRLILGEDNPAARLLTRPGEAYYNPQGGLIEGNTRFQVAWLPAVTREAYLQQIASNAKSHGGPTRRPTVFEGNAPAKLEEREDHPLRRLLELPWFPRPAPVAAAWVGEPIAITDPTACRFSRRAGRNLLIVGRDEEVVSGMFSVAVLSLAAQHRPGAAEFHVVDVRNPDLARRDWLIPLREALPHSFRIIPPRKLEELVRELHETVSQRIQDESVRGPSIYLIVPGLHRLRALRRRDPYALTASEDSEKENLPDQFATVLREGPEVGVHILAWTESLAALSSIVDRHTMGDIGLRVALAVSDKDSNDLLDSSAAAKLGPLRALLYDDERIGTLEKFRPYQVVSDEWLAMIGAKLKARSRNSEP